MGQYRPKFCVHYAKKYTSTKKVRLCQRLMANVMFFPFFGGSLLPYTETSKLKADSSSRKQWESFHQSVTLNSYRTDRIDVKQTINIICDKEKKDCFQTSSCMIYRSIQCDVLWRASTRFFHSSIKELLPPGRGPATGCHSAFSFR